MYVTRSAKTTSKKDGTGISLVYTTLLKELLAVNKFQQCDLSSVVSHIPSLQRLVKAIVEYSRNSPSNELHVFHAGNEVLSKLTMLKLFLNILLQHQQDDICIQLFTKVFDVEISILQSLVSLKSTPITERFLASEVASLYIFVCEKLSVPNKCFEDLRHHLKEERCDLTLLLYIIDNLCLLGKDQLCDRLNAFLCELFSESYFTRHFFHVDEKIQVLMLRIYTKSLNVTSNDTIREKILETIESMMKLLQTTKNVILWNNCVKFLNLLLKFPHEESVEPSILMHASRVILSGFDIALCKAVLLQSGETRVQSLLSTIAINLCLKSIIWLVKDLSNFSTIAVKCVEGFIGILPNIGFHEQYSAGNLLSVFMEEDEDLIDFLLLHLEIYISFIKNFPNRKLHGLVSINPWELFLELILNVSFDISILNDWLVSNETRFLLYFVKFLKFTRLHWKEFLNSCEEASKCERFLESLPIVGAVKVSDACVSTLIKLRNTIVKLHKSKLYPYSPDPLVNHLNAIEGLFESGPE